MFLRGFALVAVLALVAPVTAIAQSDGQDGPGDETVQIRGVVSSFDGAYALVVRDEQGYLDNIQLHEGTIINPLGITLAPGMVVSVVGFNGGSAIDANEIDTPYVVYGGVPYYEGHPWTYFGAGVALGVFFASADWWHGGYFGGGYRVINGRRYWAHVDRVRLYRGGYFRGHEYIVDVHHGGWAGHGDRRVLGHYEARGPEARRLDEHGIGMHDAIEARNGGGSGPVDIHGRPVERHVGAVGPRAGTMEPRGGAAAPRGSTMTPRTEEARNSAGSGAVDIHGRPVETRVGTAGSLTPRGSTVAPRTDYSRGNATQFGSGRTTAGYGYPATRGPVTRSAPAARPAPVAKKPQQVKK
ncbi:MAG: hypothetical protein WAK29_12990 [Terriglobales bacterium]